MHSGMTSTNTAKPKLACEIAADRVLAGRVMEHGGGLEASFPTLWNRISGNAPRCAKASRPRWAELPGAPGM